MRHHYFIYIVLICSLAHAGDASFHEAYEEGKQIGKEMQGAALHALHKDPHQLNDHYTDHPKESDYFDVNQTDDAMLKQSVTMHAATDATTQEMKINRQGRPEYTMDDQSRAFKMNQWLLAHAFDLTHEKKCQEIPACKTVYENKMCFASPEAISRTCREHLVVDVDKNVDEKHYPIIIHLRSSRYYMSAIIDLRTGLMVHHGPKKSSASIEGLLPNKIDCQSLYGSVKGVSLHGHLVAIGFPTCTNGLTVNVSIEHSDSSQKAYGSILLDIVSRHETTKLREHWESDCANISDHCTQQATQCVQGPETRIIAGQSITRDCWAKEISYRCANNSEDKNTCAALDKAGCDQIDSVCRKKVDGQCTLYEQTYRCAKEDCTYETLCTDVPTCIDGDCSAHVKQDDPDFKQAVGAFGTALSASATMDKNTGRIFSGEAMSCSKAPIGFLNCCGDGGWGEILNFKCDAEELKLKSMREGHLAIKVGEYCGDEVLGQCISYRKRYCVFPTKMARLIQKSGRYEQLQHDFGSAKDPKCDGITADDLQRIDFGKIDFSEIAEDIKNAFPAQDPSQVVEKMQRDIQERQRKKREE